MASSRNNNFSVHAGSVGSGRGSSRRENGGDPNKTGDLSAASRAVSASAGKPTRRSKRSRADTPPRPMAGRASRSGARRSVGAEAPHVTAAAARRVTKASPSQQTNLMKYAADNRLVRAVYDFTTAYKPLFIALVAVAVAVGVYFPVRDFYIAQRTQNILQQQVEIRKQYNDSLGKEVKQYLSQEGIEDAARKDLGMAMPGEKTITVEGLDEDGNPVVKQEGSAEDAADQNTAAGDAAGQDADDQNASTGSGEGAAADDEAAGGEDTDESDAAKKDNGMLKGADAADKSKTGTATDAGSAANKEPSTSAEVEAAEQSVLEDSPWYWKMLDALFFFDGSNGMAVTSTGDTGK